MLNEARLTPGEATAAADGLIIALLLRRLVRKGVLAAPEVAELTKEALAIASSPGDPFLLETQSALRAIERLALVAPTSADGARDGDDGGSRPSPRN